MTLDTTRADHLSAYGHPRSKTPNIDRVAAQGVLFERAMSAVPITLPSHSTIMTGRYPPGHGVRDNGLFRLAEEQVTLAEILQSEGYATAAAVGAFPLVGKFGIGQGFDYFNDRVATSFEDHRGERVKERESLFFDQRNAQQVNSALLPWIEDHAEQPFFAWLHYFDPHRPWNAQSPFSDRFPNDGYLAEIAYTDHALGQLLSKLEALGVLDNTVIVITSDHGEGMGQHNEQTHSLLNYSSTLHVPLIIKLPGKGATGRVSEIVGTVDITPTILATLNIENRHLEQMDGQNLLPLVDPDSRRYVAPNAYYAETLSPRVSHGWGELRTMIDGDYKYIHGPQPELYNLTQDPHENVDLMEQEPDLAAEMKQQLALWLKNFSAVTPAQIDADSETVRRLMSLGYISGGGELGTAIEEKLINEGIPPQERVVDNGLMSSAKDLIFRKQYGYAMAIIEELRARDRENWVYMDMQLRVLMGSGDLTAAHDLLDRERAKRALRSEHALIFARLLATDGDVKRAVSVLLESEAQQPTPTGQFFLAALYEQLGDKEMAGGALLAATTLDREFSPAVISLAIRYAVSGQEAKAEELLSEILKREPFHIRALYNLGALYAKQGNHADARALFQRCLAIEPGYTKARDAMTSLEGSSNE